MNDEGDFFLRLGRLAEPFDGKSFRSIQFQGLGGDTFGKSAGKNSHADQVGAVDPLKTFGDDGTDTEQASAFGCPVARATGAILFSSQNDERNLGFSVGDSGVVN